MAQKGKPKEQKHAPIIKRKLHAEEEGGHGGVWKLAFADFMTAMMTFFLVMWLVNSASKEKIIQLASYFNPVKLSDRTPPSKAVHDPQKSAPEEENTAAEEVATKDKNNRKPGQKSATPQRHEEENLFRNPFGVLTQLASQAEGTMAAVAVQAAQDKAASGGSSHDPFVTDPVQSQLANRATGAGERQGPVSDVNITTPPSPKAEPSPAQEAKRADTGKEPGAADKQTKDTAEKQPKEAQAKQETQEKAAELEKELARLIGALPPSFRPNVSTKATAEGILVSLTDDANFSMFRISSSEPSPQLVVLLEKAGSLISKYPGKIVIRGHTDGRPYAGDAYGNWRLSVNRATMTYYMLLRGKVDDGRFLALEGYADRKLRNKANPLAGENRRIEILIKGPEAS
jgi:chemotaxis protein MotB